MIRQLLASLPLVALGVMTSSASAHGETLVRIFNVGQGDGTLIYCPVADATDPDQLTQATTILVDFGSAQAPEFVAPTDAAGFPLSLDAGRGSENILKDNLMRALGRTNPTNLNYSSRPPLRGYDAPVIDHLIITHADDDHWKKLWPLVEKGFIDVRNAYVAGSASEWGEGEFTAVGFAANSYALNSLTRYRTLHRDAGFGSTIPLCGDPNGENLQFRFLMAGWENGTDANDRSVVMLMRHTDASGVSDMWFMADAMADLEAQVANTYRYDFDTTNTGRTSLGNPDEIYLRIGHHGSNTSSTRAFLRMFPKLDGAYVSASFTSKFLHPRCDPLINVSNKVAPVSPDVFNVPCWGTERDAHNRLKRKRGTGSGPDTLAPQALPLRVVSTAREPITGQQDPLDIFIYFGGS